MSKYDTAQMCVCVSGTIICTFSSSLSLSTSAIDEPFDSIVSDNIHHSTIDANISDEFIYISSHLTLIHSSNLFTSFHF
ncbi:hypothetical protein QVD17_09605 [Tagetes erecta]|uniref:Uncharacterized protein n=1 Tax=Tagetes erecta TaxID=13708 RepID=A0AAD8P5G0_TARER|nr:hypothetical protein QVD17_09605 [Tagetes erecta]